MASLVAPYVLVGAVWSGFRDRCRLRLTVRRRCRGEHQPLNAVCPHRLEKTKGSEYVAAPIGTGVLHRLTDQAFRGEVQNTVEAFGEQSARDLGCVALHESSAFGHGVGMAGGQVVDHCDLVPRFE